MTRFRGVLPRQSDVVLAAALLAVSQLEVWGYGAAGGSPAAALTLGLCAVAMLWRSRHPVAATILVAVGLTLCAQYAGEPFSATSVLTFDIGFFSIGAMSRRRVALAALAVSLPLSAFAVDPFSLNNYLAISLGSVLTPWLLGMLWRHRSLARTAARQQSMAATQAVAAERLRLAQELHDVVSHNVGMIAVQAGAADVVLDTDPRASRESLHAIERGARETLLELRRMLGLLREADPAPMTGGTALADLPQLIEPVDGAGVAVTLLAEGEQVPLGRDVESTAYRIVQEALTNVVAHAGPCRVEVRLGYTPDRLAVDVTDDGAGTAGRDTRRTGYGLVGIRERVAAVGGTVSAGPGPDGGFAVHALLPLTRG